MAPYEFNKIEMFLKMQINHAYLPLQQDARKKWKKHDKLEDAFLFKIQVIPGGTTDTKELANLTKLNALQCDL